MGIGKFRDALTAGATGRTEHGPHPIGRSRHHGNPADLLTPGYPHCGDRPCLRAGPHGVGRILDIAANMYRA
jgi:hypothetical protein